jgi:hypothetical protein
MECCWLYPWLSLLLGPRNQSQRIPWAIQAGTILLVSYLTRYWNRHETPLVAQHFLTVALALTTSLVFLKLYSYPRHPILDLSWLRLFMVEVGRILHQVPSSLLTFLVGIYLWWRGIELAQRSLSVDSVGFSFRWGIIAFLWLFIASLFVPNQDSTVLAFGYFLFGMTSMGLARAEEVSSSLAGVHTPFNLSWMLILSGSAIGVSAFSVVSVKLFSLRNLASLGRALRPATEWLAHLASPLTAVLAGVLERLLTLLIRLLGSAFGSSETVDPAESESLTELLQEILPAELAPRLPYVWQIAKWVFLASAFVALLGFVALSIGRFRRAPRGARSAEYGSVLGSERPLRNPGSALSDRWRDLREGLLARLARLRGEEFSLASIRKTYASLVHLASNAGFPRARSQTPYEYIDTLHQAFPDNKSEVRLITEAYVRAHYGERSFPAYYVRRVRHAWLSIAGRQGLRHLSPDRTP